METLLQANRDIKGVIAGNDTGGQGAVCPAGSQIISGSCTTDFINPIREVTLQQSGFYDNGAGGWYCRFRNNEATPVSRPRAIAELIENAAHGQ